MWPSKLPWMLAEVSGPSMVPTLRHGDVLLARRRAPVRPGVLVLARFRSRPDLLVVKRVVRPEQDGWWLESDNPFAGGDSNSNGIADVEAVVASRLRPGRPGRPGRRAS